MYLPKSIKGKAIISNCEISDSVTIDCDIRASKSSAFDIGNSQTHFRNLFVDNINTSDNSTISFSQGSFQLKYNDPFTIDTTGSLALKLAKSNNPPSLPQINSLYLDTTGSLSINLQAFFQTRQGIKESKYSDYLSKLGQLGQFLGYDIPNVTIIQADIDESVLEFKGNSISLLSLGEGRVPYYNQTSLTSSYKFLWNESDSNLQIHGGIIVSPINKDSNDQNVANKSYVDNINKATGALSSVLEGNSYNWKVQTDDLTIKVNTENQLSLALNAIQPLSIKESELSLNFNVVTLKLVGNELTTTLNTQSPLILNPESNQLSISIDNTSIKINGEGQLSSALTGISPISVNPEGQISIGVNSTYLQVLGNELSFSNAVVDELTNLTSNVEELQTLTNTHTSEISALQSEVGTIQTEITTVQSQVGVIEGEIVGLTGSVGIIEGEISTINGTLSAVVASSAAIGVTVGLNGVTLFLHGTRLDSIDNQLGQVYSNKNYIDHIDSVLGLDVSDLNQNNISVPFATIGQLNVGSDLVLNNSTIHLKRLEDDNHRIGFPTNLILDGPSMCGATGITLGRNASSGNIIHDLVLVNGKLGMGTTSPSVTLDIHGNSFITTLSTGTLITDIIKCPQVSTNTANINDLITYTNGFTFGATINNLFSTSITATNIKTSNGTIDNLFSSNATLSNIKSSTLSTDSLTVSNLITSNLTGNNTTLSNIKSTTIATDSLTVSNLITGSLTGVNLNNVNGTITNLYLNNTTISNLYSVSSTLGNVYSTNIKSNSGTISNLITTNATMASFYISNGTVSTLKSNYANISSLNSNNTTISNLLVSNTTISNLQVSSSLAMNSTSIHLKTLSDDNHRIGFDTYSPVDGMNLFGNNGITLGRNNSGTALFDVVLKDGNLSCNGNIGSPQGSFTTLYLPIDSAILTGALGDNFTYNTKVLPSYGLCFTNDPDASGIGAVGNLSSFGGLKLFTEHQERVSILGNGNVGIGINNPMYSIDVAGAISCTDKLIINSGSFDGTLSVQSNHLYVPTDNSMVFDTSQQYYWRKLPYVGDITRYINLMNLNSTALNVLVDLNVSGKITGNLQTTAVNNTLGSLVTSSTGITINGKTLDGSLAIQGGHLYSSTNVPLVLDSYGIQYFRTIATANQTTTYTDTANLSASGLTVSGFVKCSNGFINLNSTTANFGLYGSQQLQVNINMPAVDPAVNPNLNIGVINNSFITFWNGTNVIGSITRASVGTVSYNTSSDYRLKENVKEMSLYLDKISKVNPVSYNYKNHSERDFGFLAHELQEIVPEAVIGLKDELNEDNTEKYQQVNYSKLTPILWKAIQELKAELDTVKVELKQLREFTKRRK